MIDKLIFKVYYTKNTKKNIILKAFFNIQSTLEYPNQIYYDT